MSCARDSPQQGLDMKPHLCKVTQTLFWAFRWRGSWPTHPGGLEEQLWAPSKNMLVRLDVGNIGVQGVPEAQEVPGMEQWRLSPATEECSENAQCQAPQVCCPGMGSVGLEAAQQSPHALATALKPPQIPPVLFLPPPQPHKLKNKTLNTFSELLPC